LSPNAFRRDAFRDDSRLGDNRSGWLSPMPFGAMPSATPSRRWRKERSERHQCLSARCLPRRQVLKNLDSQQSQSPMPFGAMPSATRNRKDVRRHGGSHQCLSARCLPRLLTTTKDEHLYIVTNAFRRDAFRDDCGKFGVRIFQNRHQCLSARCLPRQPECKVLGMKSQR
jgi:hypothetical protein